MAENVFCSVVVPVFNEEEVVQESYKRLKGVLDSLSRTYEVIFVNDGSRDLTLKKIREICRNDKNVKLIDFSRNFGHQIAITSGMDHARGQVVVVIDADLQDPPELIPEMIKKWEEGYEVVYGQRIERKGESFFKKITAKVFYRTLKSLTDIEIPVDAGDFRLIDRKVCDALKTIEERNRYVRGIVSWLGFKQIGVEFSREKRFAGVTKYPLKKMLKFAFDAITSFSHKPLKLATYAGMLLSIFSFTYLLVVIYLRLFTKITYPGWASTLVVNLFFNGIILIILGIVGEYIGRIYDEVKGRPMYVIREKINMDQVDEK